MRQQDEEIWPNGCLNQIDVKLPCKETKNKQKTNKQTNKQTKKKTEKKHRQAFKYL